MCGKSFGHFSRPVGRIGALLALLLLVASPCFSAGWTNPLYPAEKEEPASAVISESAPTQPTTEAPEQLQSATSSTGAAETPTGEEQQPTPSVDVSDTALAQKVETGSRTVKLTRTEAEESYQVMLDQAESIGALAATVEERDATIKGQDEEISTLQHEIDRWHLGLGFGAMANLDADFGAAAYLTLRKHSFIILGGVGYIPIDADYDEDRFDFQLGVIYEF